MEEAAQASQREVGGVGLERTDSICWAERLTRGASEQRDPGG